MTTSSHNSRSFKERVCGLGSKIKGFFDSCEKKYDESKAEREAKKQQAAESARVSHDESRKQSADAKAAKAEVKAERAPTLRSTIWFYFSMFTAAILMLIWVFQVATLNQYYEFSMRRKIVKVSTKISLNFDDDDPTTIRSLVEDLAYENGMTIAVTDWNGNEVAVSDFMGGYSVITSNDGYMLFGYRNELLQSYEHRLFKTFQNERFGTTELLYGAVLSSPKINTPGYLIFVNTSLEPINATAEIIREQFVFITLLTFFIALFITVLLSKRLSEPFTHITASANRLAMGDYSTRFNKGSYHEINELADTLNYAADEISKVDRLRNELIANVSHDLRTPLTMIRAYAEMIRDISGDNPEKRNEHLGVIIDETNRLSELVNGLLELSKLQSGKTELHKTSFSCHDFLKSVLSKYQVLSEQKGFEFILEADEDVILYADLGKLKQVMYNFINNAVNYSGDSRRIIVRQINIPGATRIEVRDFGVGIEKEKLPLIFDRYYRDERTKRDVVGSGLGLSIVKELLELHKFRFGVSSEVGSGSAFWFEIKRNDEKDKLKDKDDENKGKNSKSTASQRPDVQS